LELFVESRGAVRAKPQAGRLEKIMQVSGRIIILAAFGIALALSGGAWWYHYQASRRAAEYWGGDGARLLVKAPKLEFLELGETAAASEERATVAGRAVAAKHDLSNKPGLVHLRFVFTQDVNFAWDARRREAAGAGDWAYALRLVDGRRQLVVLLRRDFNEIGKLDGPNVDVVASPRIASSLRQYLTDIGVLKADAAPR